MRAKKIIRYVTFFMLGTYLLAFISPYRYDYKEPQKLTILVLLYIGMFYIGGVMGIKHAKRVTDEYDIGRYRKVNIRHVELCLIILFSYTLISMISSMMATGIHNLGEGLRMSITSSSKGYYARADFEDNKLMNYITILLSPVFIYGALMGLLQYKELSKVYKIIYIFYIVFEILRWMFVGTNKGIFDIAILFIVGIVLLKKEKCHREHKRKWTKYIVLIILSFFALWFFSITMQSRLGAKYGMSYSNDSFLIKNNLFIYEIMPSSIVNLLAHFSSYLIQGYYGLSLGLTLEWEPTFFAGSNIFLQGYIQPLLGIDVTERLFQTRIENAYDWGASSQWHTMYLWMANDFGFIGVSFVMIIIGYYLGQSLVDGIQNNNSYALCLAYLLLQAMFYSSANNQILGTYSIVTVIIFFILWKKRKKLHFEI